MQNSTRECVSVERHGTTGISNLDAVIRQFHVAHCQVESMPSRGDNYGRGEIELSEL